MSFELGLSGSSDSKESTCNVGELGLRPGLGRSPGAGHGNPLQYSCWRIPKDRGAWHAAVHRMAESDMTDARTHPLNDTWGSPVTLSVHILLVQRCHLEVKRMKKNIFSIFVLKEIFVRKEKTMLPILAFKM